MVMNSIFNVSTSRMTRQRKGTMVIDWALRVFALAWKQGTRCRLVILSLLLLAVAAGMQVVSPNPVIGLAGKVQTKEQDQKKDIPQKQTKKDEKKNDSPQTPKETVKPVVVAGSLIDARPKDVKDAYPTRRDAKARFRSERTDRQGRLRPDLWAAGVNHVLQMKGDSGSLRPLRDMVAYLPAMNSFMPALQGPPRTGTWEQIGPSPLDSTSDGLARYDAGEVVGIAINPRGTSDEIIYAATGYGGIWKTTDGGYVWNPMTDGMPSLSMGAVALDPADPEIVYAGTGNPFDSLGVFTNGLGLYKSENGGRNWTIVGANAFGPGGTAPNSRIYRIVLPSLSILLVATNQGLFRSVDGGRSFGANDPRFNDGASILSGDINDLALDTGIVGIVYSAVNGRGLFKSIDGGRTFPENLFLNRDGTPKVGAPQPGQYGYFAISQSTRPNNRSIYATVATAGDGGYLGLFKSSDGGATWSKPSTSAEVRAAEGIQPRYDQTIGVDPQNANTVYLGFVRPYLSTDGGVYFQPEASRGVVHADHHFITFSPLTHLPAGQNQRGSKQVYVGTDGGIWTSSDGALSWSDRNKGLANMLVLQIAMGTKDDDYMQAGVWDQGAISRRMNDFPRLWYKGLNGDGGVAIVDPANSALGYQAGNFALAETTNGGRRWGAPAGFVSLGAFRLAYTAKRGPTILTTQDLYMSSGPNLMKYGTRVATFPANIMSIATTLADPDTMWLGMDDGTIWRTSGTGGVSTATWVNVGAPGGRNTAFVVVNPLNPRVAVAVYSGFSGISAVNRTQHVFLSTDNGARWTDISGTDGGTSTNLPDLPVFTAVFDVTTTPHSIIIGSDGGVFRTVDEGRTWARLGTGLPIITCYFLAINTEKNPPTLRASTFGRSIFELRWR